MTDDDIRPFLTRVKSRLDEGYSFERAVRVGLKGILVSPEFLFLREKPDQGGPATATSSVPLDDYALASRLSSSISMP